MKCNHVYHGLATILSVVLLLGGCKDFLDVKPKGKDIPEKLEPPPKQPMTMSGYSPAISICFSASRPITVWCSITWFKTLPNVYLQFGVCRANSIASEIAVPKLP